MTQRDWNAHYTSGELPWDTGDPDPFLVELMQRGTVQKGRALEVGCGTGTNAVWLAEQGFDVFGLDLAPAAIERARVKAQSVSQQCRLEVRDFLQGEVPPGSYDLVFDRGCFHVFSAPSEQASFAARVAALLAPGGHWLSLVGSTEGAPREVGPPRRNAREILNALEPVLELVALRAIQFTPPVPSAEPPKAWFCLSRRRETPAQASSSY